jgi:hypothetical protein
LRTVYLLIQACVCIEDGYRYYYLYGDYAA